MPRLSFAIPASIGKLLTARPCALLQAVGNDRGGGWCRPRCSLQQQRGIGVRQRRRCRCGAVGGGTAVAGAASSTLL